MFNTHAQFTKERRRAGFDDFMRVLSHIKPLPMELEEVRPRGRISRWLVFVDECNVMSPPFIRASILILDTVLIVYR